MCRGSVYGVGLTWTLFFLNQTPQHVYDTMYVSLLISIMYNTTFFAKSITKHSYSLSIQTAQPMDSSWQHLLMSKTHKLRLATNLCKFLSWTICLCKHTNAWARARQTATHASTTPLHTFQNVLPTNHFITLSFEDQIPMTPLAAHGFVAQVIALVPSPPLKCHSMSLQRSSKPDMNVR